MATLLITLVVFGMIIFVHELGHFVAARWAGVRVEEFAIGFGPTVFSRRRGKTLYSLRLLPLGGFVRMGGVIADTEEAAAEDAFLRQPVGKRAVIMVAGSAMNFTLAVLLFAGIFFFIGTAVPLSSDPIIGEVVPGYPAEDAGLRPGDRVVSVDGHPVEVWTDMSRLISARAGQETTIVVRRDGETVSLRVTPTSTGAARDVGTIGVLAPMAFKRLGLLRSLKEGFVQTFQVVVLWVSTLVLMIFRQIAPELAGPVGIGQLVGQAARMGLAELVYLAAALSANIGVLNLMPVPALDGSRLAFLGLEKVRRRPLRPEQENLIHLIGFALLIALAVIVTYQDIARLNS